MDLQRAQHTDRVVARAVRAPDRERPGGHSAQIPPPDAQPGARLSRAAVLGLQRTAGNAAVARRLSGVQPGRTAPAAPPVAQRQDAQVTVQRGKSSEQLKKLAIPRVAEGPAIKVQTELVDALDGLVEQKYGPNDTSHTELNLGGVLVESLPNTAHTYEAGGEGQKGLYNALVDRGQEGTGTPLARWVDLPNTIVGARSNGLRFSDQVQAAGLGPKVTENVLKTMIDAEQFEYLRLAGLPDHAWKIVAEVHYIRIRPKDMAGFHKDTHGQSLFVNLNYHVPGTSVRGPEYIVNPKKSGEHDERIYGTPATDQTAGTPGTLPTRFTNDLTKTRASLGKPTVIESAGTVKPLGYVAFVDEAIHHATPWFGHRYITPVEFRDYLERNHRAKLDEIIRADQEYQRRPWKYYLAAFSGYVNKDVIKADEVAKWRKWLEMINAPGDDVRYTRHDFATTIPGTAFDLVLENIGTQPGAKRSNAGIGGWYSGNIPGAPLSPIKTSKKRPPLERRASNANLASQWPKQLPGDVPRRFLRTWVRAVPEDLAAKLR